jgi:hypothetical protein
MGGVVRNACRTLVGTLEGKTLVGIPRRRWVDNIKIDLREIGWGAMDFIDMAENGGPVEDSCEHGNEPSGSIKCWEVLE